MTDNTKQGRVLGWDDEISHDSEFVLIDPGEYEFKVVTIEKSYHNGSDNLPPCPKAIVHCKIDSPKGSTTIKHNLFLFTTCEGMLCAFFNAIGQRQHGQDYHMDWDKAVGSTGRCKVGVRDWTGKNGNTMQSNQIERFIESADTSEPAQASGSRF